MRKSLLMLAIAGMLSFYSSASADITWGTPQTTTGDSNVSLNGTGVWAISGSSAAGTTTTVNTVDFASATRADAVAMGFTTDIGNDNGNAFQSNGIADAATSAIVEGAWWGYGIDGNQDPLTIASNTITGLNNGDSYEVQIWAMDTRNGRHDGFISSFGDGTNDNAVDVLLNVNPVATPGSGPGQYVIGNFVADGTSQSFSLLGTLNGDPNAGRAQINAIQLRNLSAIPEPTSLAVLGLAGLGMIVRRRR